MNDVAASYGVVIVDAEKVMAGWEERDAVFSVFEKHGIDVMLMEGW